MGLDVFGVFERRDALQWVAFERYYDGRRGFLRAWLGCAWHKHVSLIEVQPIKPARGLPADFIRSAALPGGGSSAVACDFVGDRDQSWVTAEELLNALPALATRTLMMPMDLYRQSWAWLENDPERWRDLTGLSREPYLPKLTAISARPEMMSDLEVPVDCIYDFSEEVSYFTEQVSEYQLEYGQVRFVYGFS